MANENKGSGAVIVNQPHKGNNPLAGAKPVAAPSPDSESPPVFHATVDASADEVWVLPLRTEHQVRIGVDRDGEPAYYGFEARKKTKVPRKIIPHLERVGIIGPSIH